MTRDRVVAEFADRFGRPPDLVVRSPGRVNLIGDHTDYNDGFVLPIATEQATWLAAGKRGDREVHVTALGHGSGTVDLDRISASGSWLDYVAGTLAEIEADLEHGFDAVVLSDLPAGAGLSSSAALEIAVALAATELSGSNWDPQRAARAAQRAENEFVGVPSGIMDQLAVAAGVRDHALLIDCRSLHVTFVPVPDEVTIVVLDTGTRRTLVGSRYEELQRTCVETAALLGVGSLRDARLEQLDSADLDDMARRIARHVVTENRRTEAGASSLAEGDFETFGRLMDESHFSLRDDYGVSGPELDAVSEAARGLEGCFGARMTGAGFAGCVVALVDTNRLDEFVVGFHESDAAAGVTLYPTSPSAGAGVEV